MTYKKPKTASEELISSLSFIEDGSVLGKSPRNYFADHLNKGSSTSKEHRNFLKEYLKEPKKIISKLGCVGSNHTTEEISANSSMLFLNLIGPIGCTQQVKLEYLITKGKVIDRLSGKVTGVSEIFVEETDLDLLANNSDLFEEYDWSK